MAIRHSITLSTSEPNNEVGNLKIRQGDEQTQTLVANITENGVPKPFVGLQPFFCAKLGQTAGLGIIEQKVTGTMNPANGTLEYVMQPEDWQQLGRQTAYFSFRKMVNDHEWTEQFSTRDFNYNVTKSVFSEGVKETKKDGSTYIWTIEDMLRLFDEYIASGKTDWEEFVEQNREILESVDPGGELLSEIILARGGAQTLGERLDSNDIKVNKIINDDAISPESFVGSDYEKVQQAIDYAIENLKQVKFTRIYDITGKTLMIDRGALYYATERRQVFLIGLGGGLQKNDGGFMFNSPHNNTGDINVSNMRFIGTTGTGLKIWNGDKIIRIKSQNNEYRNVDTILSAETRWTQSSYFLNEHITGGAFWKFEANRYIDTTIQNCLVEDCQHFIRNFSDLTISANNTLRIISNVIENLSGITAKLGGSYNLLIKDNYVEFNNDYFDLDSIAKNYPHIGLVISGNAFYLKPEQNAVNKPAIKISNVAVPTDFGNGGATSFANLCAGGVLYDLTNLNDGQFVVGVGDFGKILNTDRYIGNGKPYLGSLADGFTVRSHGTRKIYYKQFFISAVPPLTEHILTIKTPFNLKPYMTVDCLHSSDWFSLKRIVSDDVTDTIKIYLKNDNPENTLNINPRIIIQDLFMA